MSARRAVVVTGASSGIGNAAAQRLAADGFTVFAGVRTDEDARRVGAQHPELRPIACDVTDADSIARAFDIVRESEIPLAGLLNNAGIAMGGPLEYLPIEDLRKQFEVNVFGTMAATQAAIPLLRRAGGRIVTIGSIASRFGAPFIGPYSASKAALAMLMDALRVELRGSGIDVVLFEFAAVKTPIWGKGRSLKAELEGRLDPAALARYGAMIGAIERQIDREEHGGLDPAIVADAIAAAFVTAKPRARYVIGKQARMQAAVALLPHATRDKLVRKVMNLP